MGHPNIPWGLWKWTPYWASEEFYLKKRRPIFANIDRVGPGLELRGGEVLLVFVLWKINISVYAELASTCRHCPVQTGPWDQPRHLNWSCLDQAVSSICSALLSSSQKYYYLPPQMFSCDQNITTEVGDYTFWLPDVVGHFFGSMANVLGLNIILSWFWP